MMIPRRLYCQVIMAVALMALPGSLGFSVGNRLPYSPTYSCNLSPWKPQQSTTLKMAENSAEPDEYVVQVKVDPLVKDTSVLLRRLSWLTWWSQLILTTVSSFTLLFARNVIGTSNTGTIGTSVLPNFLLAGTGIVLSFGSIFWTWASRRLAGRLLRKPTSKLEAATMLRKSIKVGVTLNLFGMLTSLISAEQIVGALAIKVLTSAPARTTMALVESSSAYLQPLDILVVQANTNTLFSHFTSLAALLYMTKSLAKLDPPSSKGKERTSK
jgi:hypothetical protein